MFKNKKLSLFLIVLFVVFGFFAFSNQAHAVFGVFDYADAILGILDVGDPFLSLTLGFIIVITMSFVYVLFGAILLQWAVELPINLSSPVVLGGWNFVQGLVNLFFVLALIFIAIAYILKLENFPVKKLLPRLLIVILLVNFSLLLVGIMADIAEFFMNTLRSAFGNDFIEMALIPLQSSIVSVLTVFINIILAYVTASITIYGAIPLAIAFIIQLITGTLIGSFFQTGLFVIMNLVMGSIFFMYFILFLGRIVALWLLAIFSPAAFFCLIFPQTKKWWDKWITALFQWSFLGVVAFFLLGLIVSLYEGIFASQQGVVQIGAMGGVGGFTITDSIYNYLFLIIFLFVALKATQKYVPAGAAEGLAMIKGSQGKIISRAKGFGKKVAKTSQVQRVSQRMSQVRGGKEYYAEEIKNTKSAWGKARVTMSAGTRLLAARPIRRIGEITEREGKQAEYEDFQRRMKKSANWTPAKRQDVMRHGNELDRLATYAQVIKDKKKKAIKKSKSNPNGLDQEELNELQALAQKKYKSFANTELKADVVSASNAFEKKQVEELSKVNRNLEDLKRNGKKEEANLYNETVVQPLIEAQKNEAKKMGFAFSKINDKFPDLKEKLADDPKYKESKEYKNLINSKEYKNLDEVRHGTLAQKLALELKDSDFGDLDEDTLKEFMTGPHAVEFFQNASISQLKIASQKNKGEIRDIIRNQVRAFDSEIKNNNRSLFDSLRTPGARMSGIGIAKDEQMEDNRLKPKYIEEAKAESESLKLKNKEPQIQARQDGKKKPIIKRFTEKHTARKIDKKTNKLNEDWDRDNPYRERVAKDWEKENPENNDKTGTSPYT